MHLCLFQSFLCGTCNLYGGQFSVDFCVLTLLMARLDSMQLCLRQGLSTISYVLASKLSKIGTLSVRLLIGLLNIRTCTVLAHLFPDQC